MRQQVAIVAGGRTPFVKSGKAFRDVGSLALGVHAVRRLVDTQRLDPDSIEALAFGTVVGEPGKPNLAREIIFEADLPRRIEAHTISSYCITGLRAITAIADAIAGGRIEAGIAGGAESMSHADPGIFIEPSTGLSMGQHMELSAKAWDIPRDRQDEIALASHKRASASRELLAEEIFPLLGLDSDSGPRADTSIGALGGLRTPFDENGTLTAGNSSPVTDGASAVVLMSEAKAESEGRTPLAFIRAMEYGAVDPSDGLLMAAAVTVPKLLERTGLRLEDIDLVEIHEAFAAQVLANVKAWEQGWKGIPTGPIDWERVNVSGSSIAVGHPWSATGGRIVTTLAYEMARRNARYGLVSICAAGAMAGAILLEREVS